MNLRSLIFQIRPWPVDKHVKLIPQRAIFACFYQILAFPAD